MNDFSPRKRVNRIWLMIYPRRHVLSLSTAVALVAAVALAACAVALAFRASVRDDGRLPGIPDSVALPERRPLGLPAGAAACIATVDGSTEAGEDERFFAATRSRFRLAGFSLNRKRPENSAAIIEDTSDRRQWLRRKGEKLTAAVSVAAVGTNSVTLSTPYGDCVLHVSKRGDDAPPGAAASALPAPAKDFSRVEGAVVRLVGAETSPGTWNLKRDDVMAYYNEIKTRPERLGAIFDTLAPIWYTDAEDGRQKIEGYRVEYCGEEAFFKAMGFRENDVVREVNGIKMTNRYAAEELIRRFVADDLKFAHIKMERDGEEIVQSYFVE